MIFKDGWLLETGAFTGKFIDLRRFAGLHQFRHFQRKIETRLSINNFCLENMPFTVRRGWISGV